MSKKNTSFWNQLLLYSDEISTLTGPTGDNRPKESHERLLSYLFSLDETYGKTFDPARDFEEYVAMNFCRAVCRFLNDSAPPAT
ncbi:MAG: hypothetical protein RQ899_13080 [Pseudomonadales bacterium]|nr:hypothetical protein [Pseudomonadales bacterium]